MFGFDQVAAFTHDVENAFDQVRSGRMAVTQELIGITLEARDQIRAMLEGEESEDGSAVLEQLASLVRIRQQPACRPEAAYVSHPFPPRRPGAS